MKKLLVLALVLGLTSFANAGPLGLELSVDGEYDGSGVTTEIEIVISTNIVIDMQGPEGLDYMAYLVIEGDRATAGGEWLTEEPYPRLLPGAGDMGSWVPYEYAGWGFGYEIGDAQSTGTNPGGTAFEALYHCLGPYSEYVTISVWDLAGDFSAAEDVIIVHQVPEPMTIALLGLGGLFLLRRRK